MNDIKEWAKSPERFKELRDWEVKSEPATESEPNDDHPKQFQSGMYLVDVTYVSALKIASIFWLKNSIVNFGYEQSPTKLSKNKPTYYL